MTKKLAAFVGLLVLGCTARTQDLGTVAPNDVKTVLNNAAQTMGASNLKTIEFTASGSHFIHQQFVPYHDELPRLNVKSFNYVADYITPGSRQEMNRTNGTNHTPVREEHALGYLNGEYAWGYTVGGNAPVSAGPPVLRRQPGGGGLDADIVEDRQIQLWETPHGFLVAALNSPAATVKEQTIGGKRYHVVSFPRGKTRMDGYINDEKLVERVETWTADPLLGDVSVESKYSGYRDWDGVKFPTRMILKSGPVQAPTVHDDEVFDLTISEVKPNVSVNLTVPESVRNTPLAPITAIKTTKETDGIYTIRGQNAATIAIEFRDFIVAFEGGTHQERSLAVMAEIKRLFPSKPIRYLINSQAHYPDHASGVRPYAAEGITIITQKGNKRWFEEVALKGRWTIEPDKLSQMKTTPRVETVDDSRVITDGSRQLVLYHLENNPEAGAMLFAYLPAEKILIQEDVYSTNDFGLDMFDPFEPSSERPANYPCSARMKHGCAGKALVDQVQRLNLDVDRMVPGHGVTVSWDLFLRYMGRARGVRPRS